MPLRFRWIAVPVAVTAASAFYLWYAWGSPGISGLFVLLFVVVGLVGPVFAAARLGASAPASPDLAAPPTAIPRPATPPFRNNLPALFGLPAAAGLLIGWFGGELFSTLVLVFMVMAVGSVCAFLATAAHRSGLPGGGGFERAARSFWSLVLVGGVFCCVSLPASCASQACSVGRAKAWVEKAAAEVRAVEKSTGRLPADLAEILPRVGPAPRGCRPSDGGYRPSPEAGSFQFIILDSDGVIDSSWWLFDGRTGAWSWFQD